MVTKASDLGTCTLEGGCSGEQEKMKAAPIMYIFFQVSQERTLKFFKCLGFSYLPTELKFQLRLLTTYDH